MPLVPAAQYVRMSTDHQQYSIDNQVRINQQYAVQHGFEIVRTYSDSGISGVVLKHRDGLRQLLHDVVEPETAYKAVLVYDVSRWGRFQDSDEAAHYEYLCKAGGVPVHYCAESFPNDGSMPSAVMKVLKRVMAAEYSRELSQKVYLGEKNICERGFKVGGPAGYGLRRMLVDLNRTPKQILRQGERKALATDRVILVPGTEQEIFCVREIFRLCGDEGWNTPQTAAHLNAQGLEFPGSKRNRWYAEVVRRILTDPKYVGCSVYGRTSHRLYGNYERVPRAQWTVTSGAFEALVDRNAFAAAARTLARRTICKDNDNLLDDLRRLLAEHGKLTEDIINRDRTVPSMHAYRARFGSLREAYARIGYSKSAGGFAVATRQQIRLLRTKLLNDLCLASHGHLQLALPNGDKRLRTNLLMSNGQALSVCLCRWRPTQFTGASRWQYQPSPTELNNVTIIARLDPTNERFKDFYLRRDSGGRFKFLLEDDPLLSTAIRIESLDQVCALALALSRRKIR